MESSFSKFFLGLLLGVGVVTGAWADDDEHGSGSKWGKSEKHEGRSDLRAGMGTPPPASFQKECASCHMAYPAGLLPAGSWQHLMANLSQHFGSDASLDTVSATEIASYLTSNAGTYKRVNEMPPQDRITQSYWFSRKHDKHVNDNVWSRASIGSRGNCAACHAGAEHG
ncbi:MAG: cytochrome C, partial [Rhodoferax sp.]|nr:cytochrome C [Rhodoferax sp.]